MVGVVGGAGVRFEPAAGEGAGEDGGAEDGAADGGEVVDVGVDAAGAVGVGISRGAFQKGEVGRRTGSRLRGQDLWKLALEDLYACWKNAHLPHHAAVFPPGITPWLSSSGVVTVVAESPSLSTSWRLNVSSNGSPVILSSA